MIDRKYEDRLSVKGIPLNEPLFLFRAQDKLATVALAAYRDALVSKNLDDMVRAVDANITRFVDWQVVHADKVKLPD